MLKAAAHDRGARALLNNHYLPQDVACMDNAHFEANKGSDLQSKTTVAVFAGNLSYVIRILNDQLKDEYDLNLVFERVFLLASANFLPRVCDGVAREAAV
jgi:hypothetical protein